MRLIIILAVMAIGHLAPTQYGDNTRSSADHYKADQQHYEERGRPIFGDQQNIRDPQRVEYKADFDEKNRKEDRERQEKLKDFTGFLKGFNREGPNNEKKDQP